jgi:hypothetical protein
MNCPDQECDGGIEYIEMDPMKFAEIWECNVCFESWRIPLVRDVENIRKVQG